MRNVTIYTCGYGDANSKSAGAGVWWDEGDSRNLATRAPGQSKNRAALLAIVTALERALASYTRNPNTKCHLIIRTPTKYAIRAVTNRYKRCADKDWRTTKGQKFNNPELIQYLHALLKYHDKHHGPATLKYIWDQSDALGRIRASNLAIQGAMLAEKENPDWVRRRARLSLVRTDRGARILLHDVFEISPPVIVVKSEPLDTVSVKKEDLDDAPIPTPVRAFVKIEPVDTSLPVHVKKEEA